MRRPIAFIVLAQLCGTSLWFSANSAADDLRRLWGLGAGDIGWLTNAVQGGFIVGTLVFALTGLADRFPASRIFALCSVLGAAFNAGFALFATGLESALVFRFAVGLSLAGIYPLGMKLIVSWDPERAGQSLGLLVGMLTLGTALPHGIRMAGAALSWQAVILASSALALVGAAIIGLLGDGPHLKRKASRRRRRAASRPECLPHRRLPRVGVRLLRAHVGAVRVLDARAAAVAGRAARCLARLGLGVPRHRDRRRRLHRRRRPQPPHRQRARGMVGARHVGAGLPRLSVRRRMAGRHAAVCCC